MTALMQQLLGADWDRLPPALRTHHRSGAVIEAGHMDIAYPGFMQPLLTVLRIFGVLVNRSGGQVPTVVERSVEGDRQYWRRTIRYPDGDEIHFNSYCVPAGNGQLIEFVNPVMGLQMAPYVDGSRLKYRGVRYVVKLGPLMLPIPEWLLLGHTTIVEEAIDETRFAMDFRIEHPLLGGIFRYAGEFQTSLSEACEGSAWVARPLGAGPMDRSVDPRIRAECCPRAVVPTLCQEWTLHARVPSRLTTPRR